MKKSQRIQTIVDLKAQQEHKALQVLGEQQRKVQAARLQLEQLQQYRQDYLDKEAKQDFKRVNSLLEFRAFIAKLDQAISGQEDILKQTEREFLSKRQQWETLHHNTQNLQKVCQGLVKTEERLDNKREQLESDDRASRMSRNHSGGL